MTREDVGALRSEALVTVPLGTAGARSARVVPEGAVEWAGGGTFAFAEPGTVRRTLAGVCHSTVGGVEVRFGSRPASGS